MTAFKSCFLLLALSAASLFAGAQTYNPILDDYHYKKNIANQPKRDPNQYAEVEGSPYLNTEFTDGMVCFKDTSAFKLKLRYDIYTNRMEYQINGVNYVIGNPQFLEKVIIGESVFVYMQTDSKPGYFELIEPGKCALLLKRTMIYVPQEGPKPIEGIIKPAHFARDSDELYISVSGGIPVQAKNMKTVTTALHDHEAQVVNFLETEKIKKAREENLIKVVKYYNSL